jgi:hypothetical protein
VLCSAGPLVVGLTLSAVAVAGAAFSMLFFNALYSSKEI